MITEKTAYIVFAIFGSFILGLLAMIMITIMFQHIVKAI